MVQWHGAVLREPSPGGDFRNLNIFSCLDMNGAALPKGLWGAVADTDPLLTLSRAKLYGAFAAGARQKHTGVIK